MAQVVHIDVGATANGQVGVSFVLDDMSRKSYLFDVDACRLFLRGLEEACTLARTQAQTTDNLTIHEAIKMRMN